MRDFFFWMFAIVILLLLVFGADLDKYTRTKPEDGDDPEPFKPDGLLCLTLTKIESYGVVRP